MSTRHKHRGLQTEPVAPDLSALDTSPAQREAARTEAAIRDHVEARGYVYHRLPSYSVARRAVAPPLFYIGPQCVHWHGYCGGPHSVRRMEDHRCLGCHLETIARSGRQPKERYTEDGLKVCLRCRTPKTTRAYNANRSCPDGYQNVCRQCARADRRRLKQRKRREARKEG